MSSDFYATSIAPFAPIIIKTCRAYTNTHEDFEDYYQEVCLQIRGRRGDDDSGGPVWWSHLDVDVKTVYRGVFEKLDQMVAEMEELRA